MDAVTGLQESDNLLMDVLTEKQTVFNVVLTKADKLKSATEVEPTT